MPFGLGGSALHVASGSRRLTMPGRIEQAFSKLKAGLRKGAARKVNALLKLIGKLVKSFAPEECANYFRHAGYAV